MKGDLKYADTIMAVKPGQWLVAKQHVNVTNLARGGVIDIFTGDRVRASCIAGQIFFGYTDHATHIAFGMAEAVSFEVVR